MKQIFILLFTIISISSPAQSITISPNGASALIDANSTTQGFLPPRMSKVQRDALTLTPGLIVHCNDCSPAGPYSYNGAQWKAMFDLSTAGTVYTVGQQAQGGIIIWVDDSGQHGLVAAPGDIASLNNNNGTPWTIYDSQNYENFVLAIGQGIYDGEKNTDKIIDAKGWKAYAAFLCRQSTYGEYGGWYLPSIGELRKMYQNQNLLSGISTFVPTYWSSTESEPDKAIIKNFITGEERSNTKSDATTLNGVPMRVRAVRRF
jgi:hypothetical protein